MELWYSEFHTENVKLSVRVDRQLFSGESEYQRIDVFESAEFGKFVALALAVFTILGTVIALIVLIVQASK